MAVPVQDHGRGKAVTLCCGHQEVGARVLLATSSASDLGAERSRRMLITTMNDVPGYEIEEVFGEVFGLTVRSRNVGSQFGAWLKSIRGGELKGMTKMLVEGRQHATERLVEEAAAKGADAIVAFRFDTSELGSTWTEICAYGTAVRARKLTPG
jgi:uncharacterized protein YbjQ (UPF0145 family)